MEKKIYSIYYTGKAFYSLGGDFLGVYFYIPAKDGGWDLLAKPTLSQLRYYVKKGHFLIK